MRNLAFCICENNGADQLRSHCVADQRLCFRYIDTSMRLLLKSKNVKLLVIFGGCAARVLSDLDTETPETGFLSTRPIHSQMIKIEFETSE